MPTDGSDISKRAVKHAGYLANQCNSQLHGLFVTDSGGAESVGGTYPPTIAELEDIGAEATADVEKIGDELDVPVTTEIVSGRGS